MALPGASALLGTYMYAGLYSLANGANSLVTGITPASIIAAIYMPAAVHSLPINLIEYNGGTVYFNNPNGAGLAGTVIAFFAHSAIQ